MAQGARHKPPSRQHYEETHPTVSCRVTLEVYDRLQTVMVSKSISFSDVLKIGLGILEAAFEKEEVAFDRGREKGNQEGYEAAKEEYEVTYPCHICGKTITVTSTKEKEAINQYMQEHGWGHAECINRRR